MDGRKEVGRGDGSPAVYGGFLLDRSVIILVYKTST